MDKNRKDVVTSSGLGVGYVSLIMLFAVICLTVLAVLSYQAAGSNEVLNQRSIEFNRDYYSADGEAKRVLMKLDNSALEYHNAGFLSDDFVSDCDFEFSVDVSDTAEGYSVNFIQPINDQLCLKVAATFFSNPRDERYRIDLWKTVPVGNDEYDDTLGVWDGSLL